MRWMGWYQQLTGAERVQVQWTERQEQVWENWRIQVQLRGQRMLAGGRGAPPGKGALAVYPKQRQGLGLVGRMLRWAPLRGLLLPLVYRRLGLGQWTCQQVGLLGGLLVVYPGLGLGFASAPLRQVRLLVELPLAHRERGQGTPPRTRKQVL